jgi:hypothetical protein
VLDLKSLITNLWLRAQFYASSLPSTPYAALRLQCLIFNPCWWQAFTSAGTKRGEGFSGDVNTSFKNKNITADVKVDTKSNVGTNLYASLMNYFLQFFLLLNPVAFLQSKYQDSWVKI